MVRWCTATVAAWGLIAVPATAAEKDARLAAGVQDNSFLIEEAYNQEAGVVQHITTLRRQGRDWFFAFTQEWPLGSQVHQFSYTAPYSWLRSDGQDVQGIGDILLNYRWQALTESASTPAFAPRLSLILPSGDHDKGTGNGSWGYQVNLPLSKIVSNRVTLHGNAGLTSFFDVDERRPTSVNLGGSAIYALSRDTNLLIETLAEWTETVGPARDIEREFALTVLPGVRHAFNFPDSSQLVVGLGAPITFSGGNIDYGAFLYLSFEHKVSR
jgi:Putative MetA-pathway of phenol degradation